MKKIVFQVTKNNELRKEKNPNENDKIEKGEQFFVEKIKEKRNNNDILPLCDNNRNQNICLNNENYTIELSGDEENIINKENDNDFSSFINITKQNYPHSYNNINPVINLSKYIKNIK